MAAKACVILVAQLDKLRRKAQGNINIPGPGMKETKKETNIKMTTTATF